MTSRGRSRIAGVVIGALVLLGTASVAADPAEATLPSDAPPGGATPTVATNASASPTVSPPSGSAQRTSANADAGHALRVKQTMALAAALRRVCATAPESDPVADPSKAKKIVETTKQVTSAARLVSALKTAAANPAGVKQAIATVRDDVCPKFCKSSSSKLVDVCALDQPALANAAVVADFQSVREIGNHLKGTVGAQTALTQLVEGSRTYPISDSPMLALAGASDALVTDKHAAFGVDLASSAVQVVTQGLQALAKLIVDRAKREAIGWFLDEMRNELCAGSDPNDPPTRAQIELTRYWLPSLCAYAGQDRMWGYGGGTAMLDGVRGAVSRDLKHWPGVLAGLAVGALFWADAKDKPDKSMFACNAGAKGACASLDAVRTATAAAVDELLAGQPAPAALGRLAAAVDAANRRPEEAGKTGAGLYSAPVQVLACLAGMPQVFADYGGSFTGSEAERNRGLVLAALTATPACWTLTGRGIDRSTCSWLGGGGNTCGPDQVARTNPTRDLERLSTIVRLSRPLADAQAVAGRVTALSKAQNRMTTAAGQPGKVADALSAMKPPVIDASKDAKGISQAGAAAEEYVRATVRTTAQLDRQRQLELVLEVADRSLELARSLVILIGDVTIDTLFPGLVGQPGFEGAPDASSKLKEKLQVAQRALGALGEAVALVRPLANESWSEVANGVLALGRQLLAERDDNARDKSPFGPASRWVSVITAFVTARSADDLAATLDEAATPPGAWRAKGQRGTTTVSLMALPGFFGALEWRSGQYGVVKEDWHRRYWQAPTLTLPLGVEAAWGMGRFPLGVFISVLDPAAFLQYDVKRDGRLPGASLLTALAPGVGVRVGIYGTPLAVVPMVVYRPNFRAWDAAVGARGASAIQLGVALSVDVTLFEMTRKMKTAKAKPEEAKPAKAKPAKAKPAKATTP
jgi:hypothetical protein